MAIILSDKEIDDLVQEKKTLPADYQSKIHMRPKSGHKERELDIKGDKGNEFRLILRQSHINPLDFSIILAYRPPKSNQLFRLRRYNGKSHEHTNIIERERMYDFHIHQATARYQEIGANEDSYAEPTDRFGDFNQALSCILKDCGFGVPVESQGRLL
jgi:hypothetical protein